MKVLIYLALVLQPSWHLEDKLTLWLNCDNIATVFLDGEEVEGLTNHEDWWNMTSVEIPLLFSVIGIQCHNTGGIGGLIASIENSSGETINESDNTWTCSSSYENRWQMEDFDQDWSTPFQIIYQGTNIWPTLSGISSGAKWISFDSRNNIYCRIKACRDVEHFQSGDWSLEDRVLKFTCWSDYYLKGASEMTCLTRVRRWSQPFPSCEKRTCAQWDCEEGYYCVLQNTTPKCLRLCPDLGELQHGSIKVWNEIAIMTCDSRYYFSGLSLLGEDHPTTYTLECAVDGNWNKETKICTPHTCTTWRCDTDQYCRVVDGLPQCFPKCDAIEVSLNRIDSVSDDIVHFSCISQYFFLKGPATITCKRDGSGWSSWSGSSKCAHHTCSTFTCGAEEWCTDHYSIVLKRNVPTCFPACAPVTHLSNGVVSSPDLRTVSFTCNDYYYADGPTSLQCQTDNTWSGPVPTCLQATCNTWDCPEGRYCLMDLDIPTCRLSCPVLNVSQFTKVIATPLCARYSCLNDYYFLTGNALRFCEEDGTWSGDDSSCTAHTCETWVCEADEYCAEREGKPTCSFACPTIDEASKPGPSQTFSCTDPNYYLEGKEVLHCLSTGMWDADPPVCVPHTCNTMPCGAEEYCLEVSGIPTCLPVCRTIVLLKNGQVTSSKITVQFTCNAFYYVVGRSTLKCLHNGEWDGVKPWCRPHDCNTWTCLNTEFCVLSEIHKPDCFPRCTELSDIPFGSISLQHPLAIFSCTSPYHYLSGADTLTCEVDGSWHAAPPTCVENDCNTWRCLKNEYCKIVGGRPTCLPSCPTLEKPEMGEIVTLPDQQAALQCHAKHHPSSENTVLTCAIDGSWDLELAECVPVTCDFLMCEDRNMFCKNGLDGFPRCFLPCEEFPSTIDGMIVNSSHVTANFSCGPYSLLVGSASLSCLRNAQWDGETPFCIPRSCETLICSTDMACEMEDNLPKCFPLCDEYAGVLPSDAPEGAFLPRLERQRVTMSYFCDGIYSFRTGVERNTCSLSTWIYPHSYCLLHDCRSWVCGNQERCQMENGLPACFPGDCSGVTCQNDEFCHLNDDAEKDAECLKACSTPPSIENGMLEELDESARYSCVDLFYISGPALLQCVDGLWDRTPPSCVRHNCSSWTCQDDQYCIMVQIIPVCLKSCPMLESLVYGHIVLTDNLATFSCGLYSFMVGPTQLSCQPSGYWDAEPPLCQRHDCSNWPCSPSEYCIMSDGYPACFSSCSSFSNSSYQFVSNRSHQFVSQNETTAWFWCDTYYTLTGVEILQCLEHGSWDEPEPVCVAYTCDNWQCEEDEVCTMTEVPVCSKECPTPAHPEHGSFVQLHPLSVDFSCWSKYYLVGERALSCLGGSWSGSPPHCLPRDCYKWNCQEGQYCKIIGELPFCRTACPEFDIENSASVTVAGVASITCNELFYINGTDTLHCEEGGDWDSELPVCLQHDCGTYLCGVAEYCKIVGGIPTCHSECTSLTLKDGEVSTGLGVAFFKCSTYYFLNGISRVECVDGIWVGETPTCVPRDCSTFYCATDEYCIMGDGKPLCQAACSPIDTIANGAVTNTNRQARFSCQEYFFLDGVSTLMCDNGLWAGAVPVCLPHNCDSWDCGAVNYCVVEEGENVCKKRCPKLSTPDNGFVKEHDVLALYTSTTLYRLVGTGLLHCIGGVWDNSPPSFVRHTCDTWTCSSTHFCWVLAGVPTCFEVCPDIDIPNAAVKMNSISANISCQQDFVLSRSGNLTCTQSGIWSSEPPKCLPTTCAALGNCAQNTFCRLVQNVAGCYPECPEPVISNGKAAKTLTTAHFVCNHGYQLSGAARVLKCWFDGAWSHSLPTCVSGRSLAAQESLAKCVAVMSLHTDCDLEAGQLRGNTTAYELQVSVLAVAQDTQYSNIRHCYFANKFFLRELSEGEEYFTDKIRVEMNKLVTSNLDYLSTKINARKNVAAKVIGINMRIINSIIRSIQREIRRNKTVLTREEERVSWRNEDHHEFHETLTSMFDRGPYYSIMKDIKFIGEKLASYLVQTKSKKNQ